VIGFTMLCFPSAPHRAFRLRDRATSFPLRCCQLLTGTPTAKDREHRTRTHRFWLHHGFQPTLPRNEQNCGWIPHGTRRRHKPDGQTRTQTQNILPLQSAATRNDRNPPRCHLQQSKIGSQQTRPSDHSPRAELAKACRHAGAECGHPPTSNLATWRSILPPTTTPPDQRSAGQLLIRVAADVRRL